MSDGRAGRSSDPVADLVRIVVLSVLAGLSGKRVPFIDGVVGGGLVGVAGRRTAERAEQDAG